MRYLSDDSTSDVRPERALLDIQLAGELPVRTEKRSHRYKLLGRFLVEVGVRVKRGRTVDDEEQNPGSGDGDEDPDKLRWKEDVEGVLMDFARLHSFAEKYLVEGLKEQVVKGVRKYLVNLDLFAVTCRGVVSLIRYIYEGGHAAAVAEDETMDPLRRTVVDFVVLRLYTFNYSAEHQQLLRQGGEYVVDLQDTIMKWLL